MVSAANLRRKRVAIIGLGALGSPISVTLARCGLEQFVLVDRDFVEVGNVVRHESDLRDVGSAKTQSEASHIAAINPDARVTSLQLDFGSPGSLDVIARELADCNLVISALADDALNLLINTVAARLGIPQLYSWVGNGAWCGELLRVIPDESACYECFCYRASEPNSPEANLRPKESAEDLVVIENCISPTFTGTSFDISTIAAATCRLAVQTLLRGNPGIPRRSFPLRRLPTALRPLRGPALY